jgi:hypothetical protein
MFLELGVQEVSLLTQLVEERVADLGPEIRRTERSEMHDSLKGDRETLQRVLHQLHEAVWDPTC